MLKQRVLTALALLPLAMLAIFWLPARWLPALLAVILLAGSWEYHRLAGLTGRAAGYALILTQALLFGALYAMADEWDAAAKWLIGASCAAWLLIFCRLASYQPGTPVDGRFRLVSFITALVSVTSGWFALSWIRFQTDGSWLLLLLLLIVWAADTGAYFAGRAFGKRKLARHISPGKTRAGLVGALVFAPAIALLAARLMPLEGIAGMELVVLSLVTVLVSVGGDLTISLHKRVSGIKDSGDLLPGHGGILDRLDSLLAAGPFFALGILLYGA